MRDIRAIVIHCSASPDGKPFTRDDIDRWHRERGWRMIGYHRVIEIDGTVKVGRKLKEVGAHVAGQNSHTVGVCMIGTRRFSLAQWGALANLVAELRLLYPQSIVCGHRDYSPDQNGDGVIEPWEFMKECPGFDVSTWMLGGMQPLSAHTLEDLD